MCHSHTVNEMKMIINNKWIYPQIDCIRRRYVLHVRAKIVLWKKNNKSAYFKNCTVDLRERSLKGKNEKLQSGTNPLCIRYTPKLDLILQLSGHRLMWHKMSCIAYVQSTPNNLNPLKLVLCNNLNQNWFPLDFHHTFTVILPLITQTIDNSKQCSFPLSSFSM